MVAKFCFVTSTLMVSNPPVKSAPERASVTRREPTHGSPPRKPSREGADGSDRFDRDVATERLHHRAAVGDAHQARPLLLSQRTGELDLALDTLDAHRLRGASLAVGLVRSALSHRDRGALERPALAIGINSQRHRRAS